MEDDDLFLKELAPGDGNAQQTVQTNKNMNSDKYWEERFDYLLKQDLINVPKDYYDEQILFDDPDQLMEVFAYLEEQNLKNIQSAQDIEQDLDKEKAQEIKKRKEIGGEIEA